MCVCLGDWLRGDSVRGRGTSLELSLRSGMLTLLPRLRPVELGG